MLHASVTSNSVKCQVVNKSLLIIKYLQNFSKMKITVKSLKGGSSLIEVTEKTSIIEVKKLVEKDINIPAPQQTLVLLGKTLQDDKLVEDYPKIKDGTKIYVAIKKPETLNAVLNRFLRKYYSEDQCKLIVDEFMRNFQSKVDSLSLDDLERIAKSELGE